MAKPISFRASSSVLRRIHSNLMPIIAVAGYQANCPRKSTDVLLATDLVAAAKALGINLSRACEAGLEAALKEERKRRWQEENAEAIKA